LRKTLPDAIKTSCGTCSVKEKANTRKVILHMEEHKKGKWEEVEKKFGFTKEQMTKFNEAVGV
jgi:hypothetical protein